MEKRLGNIYGEDRGTGFAGNVWDTNAVSPTLTTMQGGGRQPMIIAAISTNGTGVSGCIRATYYKNGERNIVENVMNRKGYEGVVETVKIKQATKEGYIECKIGGVADLSFPSSETRRGRVQEGGDVCPTLTATESEICRIEKVGQISNEGSQCGTVVSSDGLSPNLVAGTHGYANHHILTRYRIRKLTPLECWRLMDFSDEDFHKAESVNSNTQLYKQAGNSIVRNVLASIFGQMLPGKEDEYKKGA